MEDKTDKYEKLRNQVVWAVTHYGIVNTDGIIETLRETVLELDTDKLQNTSSNSDCSKCPCCDAPWNIRENDSCSCGAFITKRS